MCASARQTPRCASARAPSTFALTWRRAQVTDIARSVAKQWAQLDAAALAPYEEKARVASERYYAVRISV